MVPPSIAAETLRLFLAIPRRRIEQDIAATPDNFDRVSALVRAFYFLPDERRTAEATADRLHNQMIQACAARAHPEFPDIIGIHLASTPISTGRNDLTETSKKSTHIAIFLFRSSH